MWIRGTVHNFSIANPLSDGLRHAQQIGKALFRVRTAMEFTDHRAEHVFRQLSSGVRTRS